MRRPPYASRHGRPAQRGDPGGGVRGGRGRVGLGRGAALPCARERAVKPPGEPHPDLAPLLFLLGRWEGAGIGGYPTIESFRFGQEISFTHNGKPYLIYVSRTWLLDEAGVPVRPLATESGYWRPQPGGDGELVLAHPTRIAALYLGGVTRTPIQLPTQLRAPTPTPQEVPAR